MSEHLPFARAARPGYRLHRFEAFNWGTFDSTRGSVYALAPEGRNALLIGQNGSGKSTLVDGLLTLLVRPVVRNYNVAAGARKQERDERTYVKGAFGRTSRDEDNRGEVQFLRPDGKHYSALLAAFVNEDRAKTFTIAQVLYLTGDGKVEKCYCFSAGLRSLAGDCSGFTSLERMPKQLEERGWRVSKSYKDFHQWFVKATGVKPKAMDMFNQTVAVKDIQSLTDFIRKHMLEANPWSERVDSVLQHFTLLSEAHASLVQIRKQAELLEPIARKGARYRQQASALDQRLAELAASDVFFATKHVELFGPHAEELGQKLAEGSRAKERLHAELAASREEERRLRNEIESAGGERLRQIPLLVEQQRLQAERAREGRERYRQALALAEAGSFPIDQEQFQELAEQAPRRQAATQAEIAAQQTLRDDLVLARAELIRHLDSERQELESLQSRQGNLPRRLAELRRELCAALRVPESELPFAAELISVAPDHAAWEASAEMVLRPLALCLLTPERHYRVVSRYVEQTRLVDARGVGQRLAYLRIGPRSERDVAPAGPRSLLNKLQLREGHPLLPWLRGELADRFDFTCCETLDEFHAAGGLALTSQRHVKLGRVRHEKDDRPHTVDPRSFVLGWDNREKQRRLAAEIVRQQRDLADLDAQSAALDVKLATLRQRLQGWQQAASFSDFAAIDPQRYEREIAALVRERDEIERKSDVVQTLRARLKQAERRTEELELQREELVAQQSRLADYRQQALHLVAQAQKLLAVQEAEGTLAEQRAAFGTLEEHFAAQPLTVADVIARQYEFGRRQRDEIERLRATVEPLREQVCAAMNQFLRAFGEQRRDLDAQIDYLDSFLELQAQIQREDLPRHEERFKQRLNEKVTQEIGMLNGSLQNERTEIQSKIDMLNASLRQLEYRPGTHMRLEARLVRDREIHDFRLGLAECLSGAFEGTLEADEARYRQIEKLVTRLREEGRWRDKVTDVRRWFDFAAVEIEDATGEQRAYYEDSAGQSGGEKAKLAFTILVAAIAYQYDIDPERPQSDRFHFVVVDEMFSKVDDRYAEFALELFEKFGLQLLIVAPLDAKARVTEPYVGYYAHVVKDADTNRSEVLSMTAGEFAEAVHVAALVGGAAAESSSWDLPRRPR